MRDYISREDAIMVAGDMLNSLTGISCKDGENTAREYFKCIPSTDIRENVRGEWISTGFMEVKCSNCKETFHELESANFCPNCGAQMIRGES